MQTSPLFDDALLMAQVHGMVPPPKDEVVPTPARRWSEEPSCTSVYPESMFAHDIGTVTVIKNMCAACPARRECLAASIANREEHGIWAGLRPSERRVLFTLLESGPEVHGGDPFEDPADNSADGPAGDLAEGEDQ